MTIAGAGQGGCKRCPTNVDGRAPEPPDRAIGDADRDRGETVADLSACHR